MILTIEATLVIPMMITTAPKIRQTFPKMVLRLRTPMGMVSVTTPTVTMMVMA